MKTTMLFCKCLFDKIKKKFFKYQKHDNSHACEEWEKFNNELKSEDDQKAIDEYLNNYRLTTRWQTL